MGAGRDMKIDWQGTWKRGGKAILEGMGMLVLGFIVIIISGTIAVFLFILEQIQAAAGRRKKEWNL
jgi:hypothetical protein